MRQMSLVISPKDLRAALEKGNILLVDTRQFSEYSKGHIPGAVNLDLMQFHWIDTSSAGIKSFNSQCLRLLSNLGVSPDKHIVFYDNLSGMSAARGVW